MNQPVLLTIQNAHRVKTVRPVNNPQSETSQFNYRGQRLGFRNHLHTVGEGAAAVPVYKDNYPQWEVVEFHHPDYLGCYWQQAQDAYRNISQDPDIVGEDSIVSYEKMLHDDLMNMPEEEREQYMQNFKHYYANMLSASSRCASTFVTGASNFNHRQNEKANVSYQKRSDEFSEWRERALKAIAKRVEEQKPEEQKKEEEWRRLRNNIGSSATTIHEINTGENRCSSKALFVSSIYNKVSTFASHGEVEIVDKALAYIREWNAREKKPIITERHKFFQLSEVARKAREQLGKLANTENKECPFDGGKVVLNYEKKRIQIFFDEKPDQAMINRLGHDYSFNWAPTCGAWQRIMTPNAKYATRKALEGLNLKNL